MLSEPLGFPPETMGLFAALVAFSIYVDIFVHRKAADVSVRDAGLWSAFWVALSFGFYGYLRYHHGEANASLFLSGYVLEKSLSVDNLMVFIVIFKYFRIERALQHRILYYGIVGAIVFRMVFVLLGTSLMAYFGKWVDLGFAAIIAYSAYMMLKSGDDGGDDVEDYNSHMVVKWAQRFYPVVPYLAGRRFFLSKEEATKLAADNGATLPVSTAVQFMTPAFVCLIVIEASDVAFSFDSVPAVIAVTREPLLVYSAMIFAILGLRSLYFVLAALTRYLVHLEKAVICLLFFIAAKLVLHATHEMKLHDFDLSPNWSLGIIAGVLGVGVVASFLFPGADEEASPPKADGEAPPA